MAKYDLLDKTELIIENIKCEEANLGKVSETVAEILGIDPLNVLVIDVRDQVVALDILQKEIDPNAYVGRHRELILNLGRLEGVTVSDKTKVRSHGMLGWIDMGETSPEEIRESLKMTEALVQEADRRIAKRIIVFPTGNEVLKGEIEDTNSPMIKKAFEDVGYHVDIGPVIKDDLELYVGILREKYYGGYGTMITTGGVGAEDKDFSVEASLILDPEAAVETLVKVPQGHGRHLKGEIRMAVGNYMDTRIVNLPGPNDEVKTCLSTLLEGVEKNYPKKAFAQLLAADIRIRLQEKMSDHKHRQ